MNSHNVLPALGISQSEVKIITDVGMFDETLRGESLEC